MIFNHRAVALAVFESLILSSGGSSNVLVSAAVPPPTDELTMATVGPPEEFCFNKNGAEMCIIYYDDLTCDMKVNGGSVWTGMSVSFCASLAPPKSSNLSPDSQPIESLSLGASVSLDSAKAAEEAMLEAETASVAAKEAQNKAKKAEETAKNAQKEADAALKAAERAQKEAQKAAEEAQKAQTAAEEADMAAEEAQREAEEAQKTVGAVLKAAEEAQKMAEAAEKASKEAQQEAENAEKVAKEAQQKAEEAKKVAKEAAAANGNNERKEETGEVWEEEEMTFFSLMYAYNRGDDNDSAATVGGTNDSLPLQSFGVRQRRGRRRAHAVRRRATATKNRRETMVN